MAGRIPLLIHATHEAGVKVGGIGAVLDGLLSAQAYNQAVDRSILAGPMMGWDSTQMERLTSPRNRLTIRYSSLHGIFDNVEPTLAEALQAVEQTYGVALLYGVRRFGGSDHEVILIDATSPNMAPINAFRYFVWQHYGIDSNRYSHDGEFNLFFSIAQPLFATLKALQVDADLAANDRFILAHEWLGMPLVFAAQMNEPDQWRTIFYAHETATARLLVEEHGGHDTRFYNALSIGRAWGVDLPTLFGDQSHYYKDAIIRQALRCDNIFAVGDLVVDELRFLGRGFHNAHRSRLQWRHRRRDHAARPAGIEAPVAKILRTAAGLRPRLRLHPRHKVGAFQSAVARHPCDGTPGSHVGRGGQDGGALRVEHQCPRRATPRVGTLLGSPIRLARRSPRRQR
ncbi:MAG: hypothetical protein R2856_20950 [Caldilineaceae bacterium]